MKLAILGTNHVTNLLYGFKLNVSSAGGEQ